MRAVLTGLILGSVFAASVMNQLAVRRWALWVARFDRWTFLPFWAFFAPDPAFAGIHLVFRDRTGSDWTPWSEVKQPGSTGWRWLWNPGRHERKALHDLLNGLAFTAADVTQPAALSLSMCHLGILAWVVTQTPLDTNSRSRQFALVEAIGHGPTRTVRPVFVSREFSLA